MAKVELNGCGVRDLQRALHVSTNTVSQTIREAAAEVPEPEVPRRIHTLELDEFWSFVGSKQRPRWTWYAWDRQRRKVVAFVNGRRTDESGQELCRKLGRARVNTYRTDKRPTLFWFSLNRSFGCPALVGCQVAKLAAAEDLHSQLSSPA